MAWCNAPGINPLNGSFHLLVFPWCVLQFISSIDVYCLLLVQSGTLCLCFVCGSVSLCQSGVLCGCWMRCKVGARCIINYGYVVGTIQQQMYVTLMRLQGTDIFEFRCSDSEGKNLAAHFSGWASMLPTQLTFCRVAGLPETMLGNRVLLIHTYYTYCSCYQVNRQQRWHKLHVHIKNKPLLAIQLDFQKSQACLLLQVNSVRNMRAILIFPNSKVIPYPDEWYSCRDWHPSGLRLWGRDGGRWTSPLIGEETCSRQELL